MATEHSQRYCDHCGEYVLAIRKGTNHVLHLLLTIITGGIWLIIWMLMSVKVGGWHCSKCGSSVYKLFTTKENKTNQIKGSTSRGGNYSIILPIAFILVGFFSLIMTIVRQEPVTLLLSIPSLVIGYLLYAGRQK